jgi:hypothetical protein
MCVDAEISPGGSFPRDFAYRIPSDFQGDFTSARKRRIPKIEDILFFNRFAAVV